jgi:hypothetical protein
MKKGRVGGGERVRGTGPEQELRGDHNRNQELVMRQQAAALPPPLSYPPPPPSGLFSKIRQIKPAMMFNNYGMAYAVNMLRDYVICLCHAYKAST